jgi:hypothetical protein
VFFDDGCEGRARWNQAGWVWIVLDVLNVFYRLAERVIESRLSRSFILKMASAAVADDFGLSRHWPYPLVGKNGLGFSGAQNGIIYSYRSGRPGGD